MLKLTNLSKFIFSVIFSITVLAFQQTAIAADTIKLGLNFTNSGMLKTQGEGTEIAVDIAVKEINSCQKNFNFALIPKEFLNFIFK